MVTCIWGIRLILYFSGRQTLLASEVHHVSVSCRDIPQNVEWTGGNFGVSDKNLIEVAEYIRSHDIDAA